MFVISSTILQPTKALHIRSVRFVQHRFMFISWLFFFRRLANAKIRFFQILHAGRKRYVFEVGKFEFGFLMIHLVTDDAWVTKLRITE